MRKENVYTSRNVLTLGGMFLAIFWLLYSLGSFLHESQKIEEEINLIQKQNKGTQEEIQEKERYLSYLKTPQRVDKEAKMQMSRKLPNEQVIVFVEDKMDILPEETTNENIEVITLPTEVAPLDQWRWLFFGRGDQAS